MNGVESINFESGYKTYAINGDESRVIRVNLSDQNIGHRIDEVMNALPQWKESHGGDEKSQSYFDFDVFLKSKIDYAFGEGTSNAVFGDMNCLAVANEKGECVLETFINALVPIIRSDMAQAAKNQQRHIKDMVDSRKLDDIASTIKGTAP